MARALLLLEFLDLVDCFFGLGLRESSSGGEEGRSVASFIGTARGARRSDLGAGVGSRVAGVGEELMKVSSFSVGARRGVNGMSLAWRV